MSEKRLYSYDKGNNKVLCNLNDVCDFNVSNVFQLLNSLADENEQLQEKIEMNKNDFFISEAKRMRLLAFIEDNGLRKEYYEWERRIWDERETI